MGNHNSNSLGTNYDLTISIPNKETSKIEEISINPTIKSIISQIAQECIIVWHDPNTESEENTEIATFLNQVCHVERFGSWKDASLYLKTTKTPCYLISSGRNGELLTNDIGECPRIISMYVFCGNVDLHNKWASKIKFVKLVTNKVDEIRTKLIEDILSWKRDVFGSKNETLSMRTTLQKYPEEPGKVDPATLKTLIEVENPHHAKADFVSLAKALCKDSRYMREFEMGYEGGDVLRWYNKGGFIYDLVESCMKLRTLESVMYCRLIVKDLQKMIMKKYLTNNKGYSISNSGFSGLLYQEVSMSREEWRIYEENLGQDFVLTNFFQADKVRKPVGNLACNVQIMIIVPMALEQGEQGFADIGEDNVIFNIFSRFTILETYTETIKGTDYYTLVLFYGMQALRKYMRVQNPKCMITLPAVITCQLCQVSSKASKEREFFANLVGNTEEFVCQECIRKDLSRETSPLLSIPNEFIGKKDQFEANGMVMVYNQGYMIPFYGYRCQECGTNNMKRCFKCTDCQGPGRMWCDNCSKQKDVCRMKGHGIVCERSAYSFWNEKAAVQDWRLLEYPNGLIENEEKYLEAEGAVNRGEYEKAAGLYQKALEDNEKLDEWIKGEIFLRLGRVFGKLRQGQKAEQCYEKALLVSQKIYGKDSERLEELNWEIADMKKGLGEMHKALEYYCEAYKIKKANYGLKSEEVLKIKKFLEKFYDESYRVAREEIVERNTQAQGLYDKNVAKFGEENKEAQQYKKVCTETFMLHEDYLRVKKIYKELINEGKKFWELKQ